MSNPLLYISNLTPEARGYINNVLHEYIYNIKLNFYRDDINSLLMSKWLKRRNIFLVLQLSYKSLVETEWKKVDVNDFEKFLYEVDIDDIKNEDQKNNIVDMINMIKRNDYFFLDIIIYDKKNRIIYTDTIGAYKSNRKYLDQNKIEPKEIPKDKLERESYVNYVKKIISDDYNTKNKLPDSLINAFDKYINENVEYEDSFIIPKLDNTNEFLTVLLKKSETEKKSLPPLLQNDN